MRKGWVLYLLMGVFLLIPNVVFALGLEGSVGVWQQDPSGYISYKGDCLSVDNELKYDNENKLFARVKIDMPLFIPNIYLMYTPMYFKENGIKSTDFSFGDVTFHKDVEFNSELRLNHFDAAIYYGIPFLHTLSAGILNVDVGLNCRILDFYAKVKQDQFGLSKSKSATIPIPMAYVGVQVSPIKLITIEGEGRGISYNGNGYYDLIGRIKISPFGPLFISGGYRYEKIKIDYVDIDSSIEFKGPFVELGFSF